MAGQRKVLERYNGDGVLRTADGTLTRPVRYDGVKWVAQTREPGEPWRDADTPEVHITVTEAIRGELHLFDGCEPLVLLLADGRTFTCAIDQHLGLGMAKLLALGSLQ